MTTKCAQCGEPNPADARFCIECGAATAPQATTGPTVKLQVQPCPWCAAVNPAKARFCVACGRDVDAKPPRAEPQPSYRPPPQPNYPPPQPRIYPRVSQPPLYVPRNRQPAPWRQGNMQPAVLLAIVAVVFLIGSVIGHRSGVPFFLFFLPLGLLPNLLRGRSLRSYKSAFWLLGLVFLLATGTLWPGIFILWLVWMVFGR